MLNFLKQAKNNLGKTSGVPLRFIYNLLDEPALLLIYHRVTILENDLQLLAVEPENFYRQIEFLKKNYNVISPDEFSFLKHTKKKLPPKTVLITFDDGYADNFLEALPILETLNVHALFYVTTSLIDTQKELWWDELERIFLSENQIPEELIIEVQNKKIQFEMRNMMQRRKTYYTLHKIIKQQKTAEGENIFRQLYKWANIQEEGRKTHRLMSLHELQQLSKSKAATIGAHTHTHPKLSILNFEEQLQEIEQSEILLEQWTGNKIKHFSYPFGTRKDYNNDSIKACRKAGFEMVCSNYFSQVHSWTSAFELPRMLIRNHNIVHFKGQIKRAFLA